MKKSCLFACAALLLLVVLLAASACAEIQRGICGTMREYHDYDDNGQEIINYRRDPVYWERNGDSITIWGQGDMAEPTYGMNVDGCTSVTIMSGVNYVSDVFYDQKYLSEVSIADGVRELNQSFRSCDALISVEIPSSVESCFGAFAHCSNLQSVVINGKIIDQEMFAFCSSLTDVSIGSEVASIQQDAFYGCDSLESISIPGSVTSIGNFAFADCSSLKSVTLSEGLQYIDYGAFRDCSSLREIAFPQSVKQIEEAALSGCASLTRVSLSMDTAIKSNVRGFGRLGAEHVTQVVFTSGTHLADSYFSGFEPLISVTFPDTLQTIGAYAFANCSSLTTLTIPDSVLEINENSFYRCQNITLCCNHFSCADQYARRYDISVSYLDPLPEARITLSLPENLTQIESEAFLGTAAVGAAIPETCTAVGSRAFAGAPHLKVLLVPSLTVSLPADVISGSPLAFVYCYPDSQAAADCAAYGIPCKIME